jgi:circadian clock protein KaiB
MGARKRLETRDDGAEATTGYREDPRHQPNTKSTVTATSDFVRLARVKRTTVQDKKAASMAALAGEPKAGHYHLRLFVTGTAPRSARAIQNLRTICEDNLQGRYDLEVIDISQHPESVKADQIVVTPTLVKQFPLPLRKLIGDLSDTERVLDALDIVPRKASAKLPESEHAN